MEIVIEKMQPAEGHMLFVSDDREPAPSQLAAWGILTDADLSPLRRNRDVNLGRKRRPVLAGMLMAAIPAMVGLICVPSLRSQSMAAKRPSFEVVSVKLHKDSGTGPRGSRTAYGPQGVEFGARQIRFLMGEAYGVPLSRINDEAFRHLDFGTGYDIVAKAGHPGSRPQIRLMLQSLLEDRFKLRFHRETRMEQVYKLQVAKGGSKLEAAADDGDTPVRRSGDDVIFRNAEVYRLGGFLSGTLDHAVIDETGLDGLYNFVVKLPAELRGKSVGSSDLPAAARFADALKPLGLQLIAGTGSVEYFVIDHAERPVED